MLDVSPPQLQLPPMATVAPAMAMIWSDDDRRADGHDQAARRHRDHADQYKTEWHHSAGNGSHVLPPCRIRRASAGDAMSAR